MSGRFTSLIVECALAATALSPSAEEAALKVRLCDLLESPERYTGRMVEVRASVVGREPELDDFNGPPCPARTRVALVFPSELKADAPFALEDSAYLKEYRQARQKGLLIEATLEGRFDTIAVEKGGHRKSRGGYGKHGRCESRLVLRALRGITTWYVPGR